MQSLDGSELHDLLRQAEIAVDRAAAFLSEPTSESLERCHASLCEAAHALGRYCELAEHAPPDGERTRAAEKVRDRLQRFETVLRHAHSCYEGWTQTVAAGASEYSRDGASGLGSSSSPTVSYDC